MLAARRLTRLRKQADADNPCGCHDVQTFILICTVIVTDPEVIGCGLHTLPNP
jgi:hypothetical protein